jgi:hypothetical protein
MRSKEEELIQRAIIQRWRLLGTTGSIVAHIPNGGLRSKATAARMKAMGVLPGMMDLLCGSIDCGLFLMEIKAKRGRLSSEQKNIQQMLQAMGVPVFVCDSLDKAIVVLETYGVIKPAKGAQNERRTRGGS